VACETVKTTANDADTLVGSDVARIALRQDFEDGDVIFDRETTPSILGNMGHDVSTVPFRRDVSGGASLLDAILYDDMSVSIHATLDRAHMQSRDLLSEADNQ
jgi:hypothetical protein